MATILRGKNKGMEDQLHQWCNDWFMLKECGIVSPTSIRLTSSEVKKVREHSNNGFLLKAFELRDDGIFRRVRR